MQPSHFQFIMSSLHVRSLFHRTLAVLFFAAGTGIPSTTLAEKTTTSTATFSSYQVRIDFLDGSSSSLVVSGPNGGGGASFCASTVDPDSDYINWYKETGTSGDGPATIAVSGSKTTITSATVKGNLVTDDYVSSYYWDDDLQDYVFNYTLGAEHSVAIALTFKATGAVHKYSQYELQELSVGGTVLLDGQPLPSPARTSIQAWYR